MRLVSRYAERVAASGAMHGTRSTTSTPDASIACTLCGLLESSRIFFTPMNFRMEAGSAPVGFAHTVWIVE